MPARFTKKVKKRFKDVDAIIVGAQGASQGGKERARVLHPKHLSKIGKHGAKIRWNKK